MKTVRFARLGFRQDGDEWIVGRLDTGAFVAIPSIGVTAIRLLQAGLPVDQVTRQLQAKVGIEVDVAAFVRGLEANGLVESVDGQLVSSEPPPQPTFRWLRPEHVRWALSPVLHAALLAVVVAGLVALVLKPAVLPKGDALVWSEHSTLVLLSLGVVGWCMIFLHELAHLVTARAAGVPGRITLGTRLQFLVAQTNVTGIWLAERRIRLTVYLAGMTLDSMLCATFLIAMVATGSHAVLDVLVLLTVMAIAIEFLIFMRTDVYFVLQDLLRCRNLYGDGAAYVRYLATRLQGRRPPHPLAHIRSRERHSIRIYTVLMVIGTGLCLGVAAFVTVPAATALIAGSAKSLVRAPDLITAVDAAATLTTVAGLQLLWAKAWWHRHGSRVHALLQLLQRPHRHAAAHRGPNSGDNDPESTTSGGG